MSKQIETQLPGLFGYRYELRPIRFLGVSTTPSGWNVKSYAITVADLGGTLPDKGVELAWQALIAALSVPSDTKDGHGVAILTMHLGLRGFWVLVDWWASGDMLMHRHLRAPVDSLSDLRDVSAEAFGPCVWELAVQAHERRAWLEHVLARPQGPDLPAYLRDGLTALT